MKTLQGEVAFDEFFFRVFGERWPGLKNSLLNQDAKVARQNRFVEDPLALEIPGRGKVLDSLPHCFHIEEGFDLSQIESRLLPYYRMDPASVVAARALDVQVGDEVLDMCAAPGGKTLVLLESLMGVGSAGALDLSGRLVANELSARRRHRMMSVFKRHLPPEVRQRVQIRGVDGSRIGLEKKEVFDRILLDAPCSGERGVLQKTSDLAQWKEKRSKSFGIRQYALLSSAWMALKPGGRIVYSTCSLSPHENDGVVKKLLKRQGESVQVLHPRGSQGESTEWGYQFLPDQKGWGPIFYSVIEKN